jgi:hypothetical protein
MKCRETTSRRRRRTGAPFSSSSSGQYSPYFDSHQFVSRLEKEGLSRDQAEGVMAAIEQVIDESMKNLITGLVTRSEMEKVLLLLLPLLVIYMKTHI